MRALEMDRHDLSSYPLKLPFIRSSKIARRERLYERTCSTEFDVRRVNSDAEPMVSQPFNNVREVSISRRASAPARKAPIEIQLENFRKKAIQMGFCSETGRSPENFRGGRATFRRSADDEYSNCRDFYWPQSQPPPAVSAPYEDSHFLWSQQAAERRSEQYFNDRIEATPSLSPYNFSSRYPQTSRHDQSLSSPLYSGLRSAEPVNEQMAKYNFPSQRSLHHFNFSGDVAVSDQSVAEEVSLRLSSQQPRSRPVETASIPCGTLPHDYKSPPALPRYCLWDGRSEARSQAAGRTGGDQFHWRRGASRLHWREGPGSLRGLLSQLKRTDAAGRQSKMCDFGRLRNHSSPLLRTKKAKDDDEIPHRPNFSLESMYPSPDSLRKFSRPHHSTYGLDFDDDNEERHESLPNRMETCRKSQKLLLNLSPIAKSSPRSNPSRCCDSMKCCERHCHYRRKVSVASKCIQTKLAPRTRGHAAPAVIDASVQTDRCLALEGPVDRGPKKGEMRSSSPSREKSESASNTDVHNSVSSDVEEAACRSFVASESGEGNIPGDFLIGVEREP